jgi:hypothetical protein
VGLFLAGLGQDYCVQDDIRSSCGNIDHIVIGKHSGPFLIETELHGGRAVPKGHGPAAHIWESRENVTAQLSDSTLKVAAPRLFTHRIKHFGHHAAEHLLQGFWFLRART